MSTLSGNRRRGDVRLTLDGEEITLRLSLAALAELEAAFGMSSLAALGESFAKGVFSAADLTRLVGPLARAGGTALSDTALSARIGLDDLPALMAALSALFSVEEPPVRPFA